MYGVIRWRNQQRQQQGEQVGQLFISRNWPGQQMQCCTLTGSLRHQSIHQRKEPQDLGPGDAFSLCPASNRLQTFEIWFTGKNTDAMLMCEFVHPSLTAAAPPAGAPAGSSWCVLQWVKTSLPAERTLSWVWPGEEGRWWCTHIWMPRKTLSTVRECACSTASLCLRLQPHLGLMSPVEPKAF